MMHAVSSLIQKLVMVLCFVLVIACLSHARCTRNDSVIEKDIQTNVTADAQTQDSRSQRSQKMERYNPDHAWTPIGEETNKNRSTFNVFSSVDTGTLSLYQPCRKTKDQVHFIWHARCVGCVRAG
jgi:hypothetical protein